MQALLGSYRWDWKDLRAELAGLAAVHPSDLIGPGAAIYETAQLKHGDATVCVAPQHAGCTGKVGNCVTTVFSAYVATRGQAWADFDVYMPERWAKDPGRRGSPMTWARKRNPSWRQASWSPPGSLCGGQRSTRCMAAAASSAAIARSSS